MTISRIKHRYLISLVDEESLQTDLVGGKAAGLAALATAGFDVPEGLVLTTRAFEDTLGPAPHESIPADIPFPSSIEEALLKVAAHFGDSTLAVRSSGVAEDLDDASFAGQYETVLGVQGAAALADAVSRCWASAFSPQVQKYRHKRGIGLRPMAVLIQRQIDPIAAGVVFTADPTTGDRNTIIINAVEGLADRLVSGEATAEEWRVTDQPTRTSGSEAVLTEDQAWQVADLADRVAEEVGTPQDVEWAIDDSRVWLLQSRPITALPDAPVEPVPIPVDIPEGYWERDVSHFPDPVSPLGRSIAYPIMNHAIPIFLEEFGMLADRIILTDIGGWHYLRTVPFGGKDRKPPPMWLAKVMARLHPAMRKRIQAAVNAVRTDKGGRFIDRWYQEWMPALAKRGAELRDVDLSAVSDPELRGHFEATVDLIDDGVHIHTLVIAAQMVGVYGLIDVARDLLGWEPAQVMELLRGLSKRSTEPARRLAELAQMAAEQPRVKALLDDIERDTVERLNGVDPEFAARFEAYRREFGVVTLTRDVKDPTMGERPELILRLISNQIATDFDPSDTSQGNEHHRTQTLEAARRDLADLPDADRQRFEDALGRAERAYPIREDNVFFTLFVPEGLIRLAALEIGQRMASRGQIGDTSDVFFLEHDEMVDAFTSGQDQHSFVERRKGELAWVLQHPGPPTYGQSPGEPPSLEFLPPEARYTMEAMLCFIDLVIDTGDAEPNDESHLTGIAASAGTYTGTVRVIEGEHQFDKLKPGDVLVCPITSPTWSVLFPSVGALVTDSGGILNHPAIIAREYRIPAVVATGNATELLTDGQRVKVDGTTGTVEVL